MTPEANNGRTIDDGHETALWEITPALSPPAFAESCREQPYRPSVAVVKCDGDSATAIGFLNAAALLLDFHPELGVPMHLRRSIVSPAILLVALVSLTTYLRHDGARSARRLTTAVSAVPDRYSPTARH